VAAQTRLEKTKKIRLHAFLSRPADGQKELLRFMKGPKKEGLQFYVGLMARAMLTSSASTAAKEPGRGGRDVLRREGMEETKNAERSGNKAAALCKSKIPKRKKEREPGRRPVRSAARRKSG